MQTPELLELENYCYEVFVTALEQFVADYPNLQCAALAIGVELETAIFSLGIDTFANSIMVATQVSNQGILNPFGTDVEKFAFYPYKTAEYENEFSEVLPDSEIASIAVTVLDKLTESTQLASLCKTTPFYLGYQLWGEEIHDFELTHIVNWPVVESELWTVTVDEFNPDVGWTLKTVQKALGLTPTELQKLKGQLPGKVFQGSNKEAKLIQQKLERQGVKSSLRLH
jgi:hypothetical protein